MLKTLIKRMCKCMYFWSQGKENLENVEKNTVNASKFLL